MKVQELKAFMEANKMSQKQVATLFNVSITTVSQYLNGKYPTDTKWLDDKVDEYLSRQHKKILNMRYNRQFVPTLLARKGMEAMEYAHTEGETVVIYGAAGLGKTQLLKEYVKNHPSAMLIETDPSYTTKVLLRKIAEGCGVSVQGSNNDVFEKIIEKLEGSERLLVIDEAELLSTRSLEFVRRLQDKTQIGVVLAGMPRLLVNLSGKNGELAQLHSRVTRPFDLGNALPEKDLALLTKTALGTDEFNVPFIRFSKGNARRLSNLIKGVVRLAEINECEITDEMIEEYSKVLLG